VCVVMTHTSYARGEKNKLVRCADGSIIEQIGIDMIKTDKRQRGSESE
jgi:hypothetical protein